MVNSLRLLTIFSNSRAADFLLLRRCNTFSPDSWFSVIIAMAGLSRYKPYSIGATNTQGDTSEFKNSCQPSTCLTDILNDLNLSISASLRPADSATNKIFPLNVLMNFCNACAGSLNLLSSTITGN